MNKIKNTNPIVLFTLCACLFTMLDNATGGGGLFKFVALAMDVLVIVYCFANVNSKYFFKHITPACLFVIVVLLINFILSTHSPRYSLLLKFFGYMIFFIYAKNLGEKGYIFRCNNFLLYTMIIIPLIVVLLLDKSPEKSTYFPNSNMFTYWGISMSLAYLLLKGINDKTKKIAWVILLAYLLVGTSLGILLAVAISALLLNIKRVNIFLLISSVAAVLLCVIYIDIPIFARLKDSFSIFQSLTWEDFTKPENVDFYALQTEHSSSGRTDNASFLWRIMQWTTLVTGYIKDTICIPFGKGADWSFTYTGKPPHNDFVLILVEYGLFIFMIIVGAVRKILKKIKDFDVIYFILPIFIYHITENLLDTFPQNIFFYLSLGYYYSLSKSNNENPAYR